MTRYKKKAEQAQLLKQLLIELDDLSKNEYFKLLKKYVDKYRLKIWEIENEIEEDKHPGK